MTGSKCGSGRRPRRRTVHRRRQGGEGFMDFLKGANNWFKDNKIISKGLGSLGGFLPGPWGIAAKGLGNTASQLGYGRRRRRTTRGRGAIII